MIALALRSLRGRTDRWARLEAALPVAAIAVCTLLVLVTLGARHGFVTRAERAAWRAPEPAAGAPRAVMAVHVDSVRGRPLTVVDWADLGSPALHPPGLDRAPAPGEVLVSPALAGLLAELPADQLGGRLPAPPAGTIGDDGVVRPDELLAVIGRAPTDPAVTAARAPVGPSRGRVERPTGIDRLSGRWDDIAVAYTVLATVACALLLLPLLTLGASAARLVAARRARDLALVRLLGATAGQAARLAAGEAAALAAAGALAGAALYPPVLPLVRHVAVQGGPWSAADLWLGLPLLGVTVAAIVALVAGSALVCLAPAVRDPLASARASRPGGARAWRLAVGGVALVVALSRASSGWRVAALPLAAALLTVNLAGPWVVKVLGLVMVRTARRAPRLLAGRRLAGDPRSGWRAVSGMALAAFVAGFLAFTVPGEPPAGDAGVLRVRVPAAQVAAVAAAARDRLGSAGVAAAVEPGEVDPFEPGWRAVRVGVDGGVERQDRARTALAGLVPGVAVTSRRDEAPVLDNGVHDLRLGASVVLVISFVVAAVAAAVGGIGRVLDQRRSLTLLRLAGTPLAVLAAARRREVTAPMALVAGGAMALGVAFALAIVAGASLAPDGRGPWLVAALAGIGTALVLGGDLLSRPVLRAATADLEQRE